jgi:predicted CoA-binding protein
MNQEIEDFIKSRRIAVVGLSRSGRKFGNGAFRELSKRGYEVFAVHPGADEIEGTQCYPNLGSLRGKVDRVLISIAPGDVPGVLREAAGIGVKSVWLQQGAESSQAMALAEDLGLRVVFGKCILMYATPVRGIHSWHRALNRIFGKL